MEMVVVVGRGCEVFVGRYVTAAGEGKGRELSGDIGVDHAVGGVLD